MLAPPISLPPLPSARIMYRAVARRDTSFVGAFVVAVKTTGIFCRPGCPARVPKQQNVEFFRAGSEAVLAGYRPCLRCRPLDRADARPAWVDRLLTEIDAAGEPLRHATRITSADLRRKGIHPARAARWFKANFGMTFQAYQRARRVGAALATLRQGSTMTRAAMQSGYQSESGLREAFESLFGAVPRVAVAAGAEPLVARWLATPLGPMLAAASSHALVFFEFIDRRAIEAQVAALRRRVNRPIVPGDNAVLKKLAGEFDRYLAGTLREFTVPIEAPGTPFQQQVWARLRAIPHGQTRSYLDIAREIGRPTATRAVARANGDNRIAILIPCHRVIGADGTLTGYGGGLWRKEWLLRHEGARLV